MTALQRMLHGVLDMAKAGFMHQRSVTLSKYDTTIKPETGPHQVKIYTGRLKS